MYVNIAFPYKVIKLSLLKVVSKYTKGLKVYIRVTVRNSKCKIILDKHVIT